MLNINCNITTGKRDKSICLGMNEVKVRLTQLFYMTWFIDVLLLRGSRPDTLTLTPPPPPQIYRKKERKMYNFTTK